MISKADLLEAIDHCEAHLNDFKDCQRLASLYEIYDHKFKRRAEAEPIGEVIVQECGNSEFLSAIRGKNASDMWCVVDDLMQVLSENNPVLYERFMRKFLE